MVVPKATNLCVFVIRDKVEKESGGLILPSSGRVKPHRGVTFSVGGKVTDPDIKKSKGHTVLFHKGVGQDIEIDGVDYLVLQEHEIIGTIETAK